MRVDVAVPREFTGDVVSDLSSRRGQIQSQGSAQVINARVPLSEMFGYAIDLRSRTRGRGTFVMHFDRYEPVPSAEDGGHESLVGAPRKPSPTLRDSQVALPEPDDDTRNE
jgi:translation elongation factor EF-G